MAIEFVEQHWITVESKRGTARLCVREPNALEGARYLGALNRYRVLMDTDEPAGFEGLMETHAALLVSCIRSSEEWSPIFPFDGNTAERREWVLRLHWEDLAKVATAVASVGYPKTSAG